MNQIIIQHPNKEIIEYVQKHYRAKHSYSKTNHYVFIGNPIKVFDFSANVYPCEKDDVVPVETVEMLEQVLALAIIGLSVSEIKEALFGDVS